jgi:hypothetical protein
MAVPKIDKPTLWKSDHNDNAKCNTSSTLARRKTRRLII